MIKVAHVIVTNLLTSVVQRFTVGYLNTI